MGGMVVVDVEELVSLMYQDRPNGFSYTQRNMAANYTLQIHTGNINHGHHMNIVDPCKV